MKNIPKYLREPRERYDNLDNDFLESDLLDIKEFARKNEISLLEAIEFFKLNEMRSANDLQRDNGNYLDTSFLLIIDRLTEINHLIQQ